MTKEEFFKLASDACMHVLATMEKKNADYTGPSADPLANFKATEAMGFTDAGTGILVRMGDKLARANSFLKKGTLKVDGETEADACYDIIGYALCLLAYFNEKRYSNTTSCMCTLGRDD